VSLLLLLSKSLAARFGRLVQNGGVSGEHGELWRSLLFLFYWDYELGQPAHATTLTCHALSFYDFSLYKTMTTRYGDYGRGLEGRPVKRDHSALTADTALHFGFGKHFERDRIQGLGTTVA